MHGVTHSDLPGEHKKAISLFAPVSNSVAPIPHLRSRYPVGICPVMDPATGATRIDELGRRSFTRSTAFGPSIGKNIALAYLPHACCQVHEPGRGHAPLHQLPR